MLPPACCECRNAEGFLHCAADIVKKFSDQKSHAKEIL